MTRRWEEWISKPDSHQLTKTGRTKRVDLSTITTWIKDSWDAIDPKIIINGFKKCGISNALDGTEDDCLWQDTADVEEKMDTDDPMEAYYNEAELADVEEMLASDDDGSDFEGF